MNIPHFIQHRPLEAVAAVHAGILMLLVPRILNYAIASYLLIIGILGLLHFWFGHSIRAQSVAALVAGIVILVRPAIFNYVVAFYLTPIGILEPGILRH